MTAVAEPNVAQSPMFTIKSLCQFIKDNDASAIERISVESLPANLPDNLSQYVSEEKRGAVESLVFEASAFQLRRNAEIEERFGADVLAAVQSASGKTDSGDHIQFKMHLKRLVDTYQASRDKSNREQAELYAPLLSTLEELSVPVKDEMGEAARGGYELNQCLADAGALAGEMQAAAEALDKRFTSIERTMNLYHYVRIMMACAEMQKVREEAGKLDGRARVLQVQINACREELKRLQSRRNLSGKEKEREDSLRSQVSDFVEQLQDYEVLISETDLIDWLDVIVEASISNYVNKRAGQAIRSGRLTLFNLLQKYCELQEAAASQVARNPFATSDPKKTIEFMMQSEQFILDYFSRKKSSMAAWLGGAAEEKVRKLASLQKDLLSEMESNRKKLR